MTGRFLVNAAARSTVTLLLGYVLGGSTLLWADKVDPVFYFVLGIFPTWAMTALRRKGREIFKVPSGADEDRPITLIEGVDDSIADRLAEVGIWEIEHLSTTNPVDLGMRTLYPFSRLLDWIDQAMLISYIGVRITAFRNLGVRGGIDLAALYGDFSSQLNDPETPPGRQKRATAVFEHLARDTGLGREEIENYGRNLYEDRLVQTIWLYWQNQ